MTRLHGSRRVFIAVCLASAASMSIGPAGRSAQAGAPANTTPRAACAPSLPAPTNASGGPLASAGTSFGFVLFHRLFAQAPRGNVFVSPLSVTLALDMLYDGARGATATAMARTLGIAGMSRQQVNNAAATLLHSLQIESDSPAMPGSPPRQPTALRVANAVWARRGVTFKPQFISDLQQRFGAQAQSLDLDSPSAPAAVNGWVSCETNGKIPQIVHSTAGLLMLLVNAVYFEGGWTSVFNPGETTGQRFTTSAGSTIQVRMMHQSGYFGYYRGAGFQALMMPYGESRRFSMIVVLPDKGTSLAQFAPRLTRAGWGYWVRRMSTSRYGTLAFPHVDLTYAATLNQPLSALGMGAIFGPRADFSGLCTSFCSVNQVLHKTFLHVDEKGTTAAAVTAIAMAGGGLPPPPPFHFVADHPFFVGIRDGRSGAVLFLGAVNKPK